MVHCQGDYIPEIGFPALCLNLYGGRETLHMFDFLESLVCGKFLAFALALVSCM